MYKHVYTIGRVWLHLYTFRRIQYKQLQRLCQACVGMYFRVVNRCLMSICWPSIMAYLYCFKSDLHHVYCYQKNKQTEIVALELHRFSDPFVIQQIRLGFSSLKLHNFTETRRLLMYYNAMIGQKFQFIFIFSKIVHIVFTFGCKAAQKGIKMPLVRKNCPECTCVLGAFGVQMSLLVLSLV